MIKTKNILFYLIRFPGYGGIESVCTQIGNALSKQGYSIYIASYIQENEDELLPKLDSRITLFKLSSNQKNAKKELENIIKEKEIDLITFHDSYARIEKPLIKAVKKTKAKLLTFEHSATNSHLLYKRRVLYQNPKTKFEQIKKLIYGPFIKWKKFINDRNRKRKLYRISNKYVVLSRKFFDDFIMINGIKNANKLCAINNPITFIPESNMNVKENIVLYVGRITNGQKRIDKMLSAWSKVSIDHPEWRFMIVGDGEGKCSFEEQVKRENIHNVIFTGASPTPIDYYKKAKIFLMTSDYEGWGNTLPESMSQGCVPVTLNNYASLTDIIDNELNGFVVDNNDEQQFIAKMSLLMNDEHLYRTMAKNAVEKSKKFQINNIVKDWIQLFDEIEHE